MFSEKNICSQQDCRFPQLCSQAIQSLKCYAPMWAKRKDLIEFTDKLWEVTSFVGNYNHFKRLHRSGVPLTIRLYSLYGNYESPQHWKNHSALCVHIKQFSSFVRKWMKKWQKHPLLAQFEFTTSTWPPHSSSRECEENRIVSLGLIFSQGEIYLSVCVLVNNFEKQQAHKDHRIHTAIVVIILPCLGQPSWSAKIVTI